MRSSLGRRTAPCGKPLPSRSPRSGWCPRRGRPPKARIAPPRRRPALQRAQLGLRGSDAPVELALRAQAREIAAQVRLGEAPEVVALAAPPRPLLGEDFASVKTSRSRLRRAVLRPGRGVLVEGWLACHHRSSMWTYNETKKESRSTTRHRLWEKVRGQHKVSAPSASFAITHQPS